MDSGRNSFDKTVDKEANGAMLACPNCRSKFRSAYMKFCTLCGSQLLKEELNPDPITNIEGAYTEEKIPESKFLCPICKTPSHEDHRFCGTCGAPLSSTFSVMELKKGDAKKLIKKQETCLKEKVRLEKLLTNLENQQRLIPNDVFYSTRNRYINDLKRVNNEFVENQRVIEDLRRKLGEENRIGSNELLPFQRELEAFSTLFKGGGITKRDFKIEKKRLKQAITTRERKIQGIRNLLDTLATEVKPEYLARRRNIFLAKTISGVVIIALILGLGIYVALPHFGSKPDEAIKNFNEPITLQVPANTSWIKTGIYVAEGENISISATGEIIWDSDLIEQGGKVGPEGASWKPADGVPNPERFLLSTAPCGSLIGRIGIGQPFLIGSYFSGVVRESGELELAVNDDSNGMTDNSGFWKVTININENQR